MANQNLNHSSFYTITSDTAIEYSKGSINYTICFQSAFLYGLAALSQLTEMGIPCPQQMGLFFQCSSCTWVIPQETFVLEKIEYQGISLPTKIEELDLLHKLLHKQVDEQVSYAVQMGRKYAAWIVNRRMVDKVTTLENRMMEESITLSFVNLAEFSRLQVPLFLNSFIFYCSLYDHNFFDSQFEYYNEVLEGTTKNPYDVLIDCLRRCGHLRSLCTLQPGPPKSTYTVPELKTLLFNILSSLCDDFAAVLATTYILTQEDKLNTVIRAVQVWTQVNNLPCHVDTTMSSEEFHRVIQTEYSSYPSILPAITLSEEETTYLIRAIPVDTDSFLENTLTLPDLPTPQETQDQEPHEAQQYFWTIKEEFSLLFKI